MKKIKNELLYEMSNIIRTLSIDAIQKANSGHPGLPLGMADVATVLFTNYLKFDAKKPKWPDRDRFILSAGHGSMLLYALSYLTGYKDTTIKQIKGIKNHKNSQVIFIDTPGLSLNKGKTNRSFLSKIWDSVSEADFLCLVVDSCRPISQKLYQLLEQINSQTSLKKRTVLVS